MTAVILAGGKGTRLRPYTVSLPKPLMPVGDHPILEILIKQLKKAGVDRVIIAVGYLESLIRAYFKDGSEFGVEILYSSEQEPLGTAGPLRLAKDLLEDDAFFFMNGDVLSDLNFGDMLAYHRAQGSLATIGLSRRTVDIDFGVVEIDDQQGFAGWKEKPTLGYLVSMGVYVFEPQVITHLPDGFFNVNDLIVHLHTIGRQVKGYEHTGFWLDIGRPDDYVEACRIVEEKEVRLV